MTSNPSSLSSHLPQGATPTVPLCKLVAYHTHQCALGNLGSMSENVDWVGARIPQSRAVEKRRPQYELDILGNMS